jgi:uncharacterized protein involved in exopolysaccharide biosynthesis
MSDPIESRDMPQPAALAQEEGSPVFQYLMPLAPRWKSLLSSAILVTAAAYGATFLMQPTYAAVTSFLPPQQQQSSAASALASLGALAGLAGGAVGIRTPADQYIALMESNTVSDRIIAQFKLQELYKRKLLGDARTLLRKNVTITNGKKDGLVTVTVEDHDPSRSAAIANQYVEELRRLTSVLAVTEAQQRRQFFEHLMTEAKDKLTAAQVALQQSGFVDSDLKTEPKAAADAYAKAKAEATAAEVKLQTIRASRADSSAEVQQQLTTLQALRKQISQLEVQESPNAKSGDYVGKYREFKYQETLFELMSKQYEIARVDESREGALIQVVDTATPPERNIKPRKLVIAAISGALAMALYAALLLFQDYLRRNPLAARQFRELRDAARTRGAA